VAANSSSAESAGTCTHVHVTAFVHLYVDRLSFIFNNSLWELTNKEKSVWSVHIHVTKNASCLN